LGQRVSRTTAERPAWFWPLLGLVFVAAIVLALLTPPIWNRLTNADSVDPEAVAFASPTVGMPTVLGDSDADGLSDEQEALLGTENTRADTDGDGLLDGEEVLVYGSNPAAADSDGDGAPDGVEVTAGTLPTDPGSVSPLAPSPVADPAPGITVTEAMTVTATPTLPSGPVLIVAPAEGQTAVPIRTGPGERYGVVVDVPGGTAVLMVRRVPDNSWYSIELADGARGWLPAAQTIVPETTNIAAVPTFVPPQQ
jgi:hypothetical protein